MIKTYDEFKVVYDKKGKIIDKKLTDRGQVRIDEPTAKVNNYYSKSTHLLYEVAEKQPEVKKPGRKPANK